jgi:3'-phosphoadenosine 5'-phosphosulfate sulfotransferase (PAPS reductase)/FAD synthetase
MKHVVMYSGGKASFLAAHRVKETYPGEDIQLLFTDTKTEDEDLYRFLEETATALDLPLIQVADGRDIWEVFKQNRFLGNNRVPLCSRILKQEASQGWVNENCPDPDNTTLYFGIDWTEAHRAERIPKHWEPYKVDFPLLWDPVMDKSEAEDVLKEWGIKQPHLYDLGAPHNNCGGLCVRAGHAHFKWALGALPERYAEWEHNEQEMRDFLGSDVAILRDRSGGKSRPLTLQDFRLRIEEKDTGQLDLLEWGGCGCMTEYDEK